MKSLWVFYGYVRMPRCGCVEHGLEYTVEPIWKGQENLTKVAEFGPFPRTILFLQIMFILPLMAGHLFWKTAILGGLYREVPLYYVFCSKLHV